MTTFAITFHKMSDKKNYAPYIFFLKDYMQIKTTCLVLHFKGKTYKLWQ